MTDEERQKLEEVHAFIQSLKASASIPFDFDGAIRDRFDFDKLDFVPDGFEDAPLGSITAPSGGGTQDAEARTAINTIITRLESLELVQEN